MNEKKKSEEFKKKAQSLIDQFQALINGMPWQGDTCEESQKLCLQKDLNELQWSVNGTNYLDFYKKEE